MCEKLFEVLQIFVFPELFEQVVVFLYTPDVDLDVFQIAHWLRKQFDEQQRRLGPYPHVDVALSDDIVERKPKLAHEVRTRTHPYVVGKLVYQTYPDARRSDVASKAILVFGGHLLADGQHRWDIHPWILDLSMNPSAVRERVREA